MDRSPDGPVLQLLHSFRAEHARETRGKPPDEDDAEGACLGCIRTSPASLPRTLAPPTNPAPADTCPITNNDVQGAVVHGCGRRSHERRKRFRFLPSLFFCSWFPLEVPLVVFPPSPTPFEIPCPVPFLLACSRSLQHPSSERRLPDLQQHHDRPASTPPPPRQQRLSLCVSHSPCCTTTHAVCHSVPDTCAHSPAQRKIQHTTETSA